MKIVAIISEYNPMHLGHIYQINYIKKQIPQAKIISLGSGSFVQRGEPSFISKHSKAKIAVDNGVDLFLEMPSIISIQSANLFAFHSVKLLNKLNIVTDLSFGVEDLSKEDLVSQAKFEIDNKEYINTRNTEFMKQGLSYKKAYAKSLISLGQKAQMKPNNTLALAYTKAILSMNSDINIMPILRKNSHYHDKSLIDGEFQSASSLRKLWHSNHSDIIKYLAFNPYDYDQSIDQVRFDDLTELFYYKAFIQNTSADLTPGYEKGLLDYLKSKYTSSLSDMINKAHNNRYSKSRLRRFVINYLLDIQLEDIKRLDGINYVRPLAFNDQGASILKLIKERSSLSILTHLAKDDVLNQASKEVLNIDKRAFKLYNIKDISKNSLDFTHVPYIKKPPKDIES